jgi:hypothetical protein
MKQIMITAALALTLGILGWIGGNDHQEAQAQQTEYCEMVSAGHWPDYEGKYNTWCK